MPDDNDERQLKETLWNIWKNNAIFRDNIAFLTQVQLRTLPERIMHSTFGCVEGMWRYEFSRESLPPPYSGLHILNIHDTLDLLLENPKSFCRFGDGELYLIKGINSAFQPYDKHLAQRLSEILQSASDKCYIGIDKRYFESTANVPAWDISYIRQHGPDIRNELLKRCNRKRLYISAIFTALHAGFDFSTQEYTECMTKIKELFRGRDLVIFSGKTVFDKIQHNVFEYAASITQVFANSVNAWSQYDEIMATARRFPKSATLCFILGMAATVLAYDLAQEDYMAWDIGHVAKEYDAFMKWKQDPTTSVNDFFAPD